MNTYLKRLDARIEKAGISLTEWQRDLLTRLLQAEENGETIWMQTGRAHGRGQVFNVFNEIRKQTMEEERQRAEVNAILKPYTVKFKINKQL